MRMERYGFFPIRLCFVVPEYGSGLCFRCEQTPLSGLVPSIWPCWQICRYVVAFAIAGMPYLQHGGAICLDTNGVQAGTP